MAESSAPGSITRHTHLLDHHYLIPDSRVNCPRCVLLGARGIQSSMGIGHTSPTHLPPGWQGQCWQLLSRILVHGLELAS